MEVIQGWVHRAIPIDEPSRVGEARRYAASLSNELGFSEVDAGRLALVVTELGSNLLRHARSGRMLIALRAHADDVEVICIDEGPGIVDLARSMRDGQSTSTTPGTGLGAIRRLSTEFDIHSEVPHGTVCVARVGAGRTPSPSHAGHGAWHVGAVCLPAPGETQSGDLWAGIAQGDRMAVLVADGLGHGPEAAKASRAAVNTFVNNTSSPLRTVVQQVHHALQTTRGAAVCALSVDAQAAAVTYSGAGNIAGRVISGIFDKSIVTQHGTAGVQIRRPEETSLVLPEHACIIMHSDGIDTRWKADRVVSALRRDPALIAALLLRDHTRHRDDATVVVLRRKD